MRVTITEDVETCIAIRHTVFVVGQQVPKAIEVDGRDPSCTHFLACVGTEAVGTARLRIAEGTAKAERVAVLEAWRGKRIGAALMETLEQEALRLGHKEVILGAQCAVVPFYERLGYIGYGAIFLDAGIDHRMMKKSLVER